MDTGTTSSENLSSLAAMLMSGDVRVVDCTATLGPSTPLEAGQPPVEIHKISEYDADGPFFAWNWLKLGEHSGTHLDTPRAIGGAQGTDALAAQRFAGPLCVIGGDDTLTAARIEAWEARHGRIPEGAWVVMHTGLGAAARQYPGPAPDAVRLLVDRGVAGLGSDCLTPDASDAAEVDQPHPAQSLLLGAGRLCLSGLTNLDQLPATGAILVAAPLKLHDGTASPVRALALIPGR